MLPCLLFHTRSDLTHMNTYNSQAFTEAVSAALWTFNSQVCLAGSFSRPPPSPPFSLPPLPLHLYSSPSLPPFLRSSPTGLPACAFARPSLHSTLPPSLPQELSNLLNGLAGLYIRPTDDSLSRVVSEAEAKLAEFNPQVRPPSLPPSLPPPIFTYARSRSSSSLPPSLPLSLPHHGS